MNRKPSFDEEVQKWNEGYHVIGIDEVGRGAFAGPLVVGAVVYPPYFNLKYQNNRILHEVRDSKLLSPQKREELTLCIVKRSLITSLAEVPVHTINKVGIGTANQIGFRKAIQEIQKALPGKKFFLLVDGFHASYVRGIGLRNQKAIIKGDQKSVTIASASIIAKVYRDRLMSSLQSSYKKYEFEKHKGYGTMLHRNLLKKYGMSPVHRPVFCQNTLA